MPKKRQKRLGYENPGGDQGKIAPVFQFTREERTRRARVFRAISNIATATAALQKAEKELETLTTGCGHRVFLDTSGFVYDVRECVICQTQLGLV